MSSSKGISKSVEKELEETGLAVEVQAAALTTGSSEEAEGAVSTKTKNCAMEEAHGDVKVSDKLAAPEEAEVDEDAREENMATTDETMTEGAHLDEDQETEGAKGAKKAEDYDEEEQDYPHVLYPGGGDFNKLRKKQKFLHSLIESCVDGYLASGSGKRKFVQEHILDKIPGGLFVHHKEKGHIYRPEDQDAFERVSQKIRDIKKVRMKAMKPNRGGAGVNKPKPARAAPTRAGDKRKRGPDLQAKDAIIEVLHSEIKILRQANNMQKQEIAKMKEVAAAQEKECAELKAEIAGLDQTNEGSQDSDEAGNAVAEEIQKEIESNEAMPEETGSV